MAKLLIFISLSLLLYSCNSDNYVEYKPHYLKEDNKSRYYGKSILDSQSLKSTIKVLEYYKEPYKITEDNRILIKQSLNKNWELLWNYTSKAENLQWLESHNIEE